MTRRGRLRLLLLIIAIVLPTMLVGTLVWYVRSGRLRERVEWEWQARFPGDLTVDQVALAGLGRMELTDLTLSEAGRPVATVTRIGLWGPPLSSTVSRSEVDGLVLQAGPQNWNYLGRLGDAMSAQPGSGDSDLVLRDASIQLTDVPILIQELSIHSRGDVSSGSLRCTWDGRAADLAFSLDAARPAATRCTAVGMPLPIAQLRQLLGLIGVLPAGLPDAMPEWLTVSNLVLAPTVDGFLGLTCDLVCEPTFFGVQSIVLVDGRLAGEVLTGRLMLRLADRPAGPVSDRDPGVFCRYDLLTGDLTLTPLGRWPCLPMIQRLASVLGLTIPAFLEPVLPFFVPATLDLTGTEIHIDGGGRVSGPIRIGWPVGAIAAEVTVADGRLHSDGLAIDVRNVGSLRGSGELGLGGDWPAQVAWEALQIEAPLLGQYGPGFTLLNAAVPKGSVRWRSLFAPDRCDVDLTGEVGRALSVRQHDDGGMALTGAELPFALLGIVPQPFSIAGGTVATLTMTFGRDTDGQLAMVDTVARLRDADLTYFGWHVQAEDLACRYAPVPDGSVTTITLPDGKAGRLVFRIPRGKPQLDLVVDVLRPDVWSRTVRLSNPQAQVLAQEVSGLYGAVSVTAHFAETADGMLAEDLAVQVTDLRRPWLCTGMDATWIGRLGINPAGDIDLDGRGCITGGELGAAALRWLVAEDRPIFALSIGTTAEQLTIRRCRLSAGDVEDTAADGHWFLDLSGTINRRTGGADLSIFGDNVDLAWFRLRFPDFPVPAGVQLSGQASLLYHLGSPDGATWTLGEGHLVFAATDLRIPAARTAIEGLQGSLCLPVFELTKTGMRVVPPTPTPIERKDPTNE